MWVGAVLAVSLIAGALVYVLALKVTGTDVPRAPVAGGTEADPGAVPRTVRLSAIPGTTFLPVSVIRTPLRARLLGLLGLLLLVAISAIVLMLVVVGGGRLFGWALESYFGG
ncbi:MAG: hypothetical protein WD206_03355 [Actinomycetota bacterium]